MINGLILDIDGVISGDRKGYNWPDPHPEVIKAIKTIHAKGIPISLCTGRGSFGMHHIVELLELDNPHVGDGGAVVIDVLANKIIDAHYIDRTISKAIVTKLQENHLYLELYTVDGYMIQQGTAREITQKHTAVLRNEPNQVLSLFKEASTRDLIKIMPIANGPAEKELVIRLFEPYKNQLTIQWGTHPSADPYEFGIITKKGVSKRTAAQKLAQSMHLDLSNVLGVGDTITDWDFITLCGYAGAMENATDDLKKNVLTKKQSVIGGSVDSNGLLDIFRHFKLID